VCTEKDQYFNVEIQTNLVDDFAIKKQNFEIFNKNAKRSDRKKTRVKKVYRHRLPIRVFTIWAFHIKDMKIYCCSLDTEDPAQLQNVGANFYFVHLIAQPLQQSY
jgi:hypothetical protein